MRKYIFIAVLVNLLFFVVGCDVMNFEKVPDTLAFQDEFTREFMASTKEVEKGYYLFESKTGGYTMLWPVNATNDKVFYEKHEERFEAMHFGESNEDSNISYFTRTIYRKGKSTEDIKVNKRLLSDYANYKGDYIEEEYDLVKIYYAQTEEYLNDNKKDIYYTFLGYIKSKNSNQGVRFIYTSTCLKLGEKCFIDKEHERENAKKIMESIKFNH